MERSMSQVLDENTSVGPTTQPLVLEEYTSSSLTTLAAGIHWDQMDSSFHADRNEVSVGLQSLAASDVESMNMSQFLQNSLCATPDKAEVDSSRKMNVSDVVRKKRISAFSKKTRTTKIGTGNAEAFQSAFDSSNDTDVTGFIIPNKINRFSNRARTTKAGAGNADAFQSALDTSNETDVSVLPVLTKRSAFSNRARNAKVGTGNGDAFQSAFDSFDTDDSLLPILTKKSAFVDKARNKKISASNGETFQSAFDSSNETNVSDLLIPQKLSVLNNRARTIKRSSNNLEAFQNVFNSSADESVRQPTPTKKSGYDNSLENSNITDAPPEIDNNLVADENRETQFTENAKHNPTACDSPMNTTNVPLSLKDNIAVICDESQNGTTKNKLSDTMSNENVKQKDKSVHSPDKIIGNISVANGQVSELHVSQENILESRHISLQTNDKTEDVSTLRDGPRSPRVIRDKSYLSPLKQVTMEESRQVSLLVPETSIQVSVTSVSNKAMDSGKSLSEPSAILHIESDYDSMESSLDSDGEQEDDSDSSNIDSREAKSNSMSSNNNMLRSSSRKALTELDINNISNLNRCVSGKQNLTINETSVQKKSLSASFVNRIKLTSENYDSMEITAVSVEQSECALEDISASVNVQNVSTPVNMSLRKRNSNSSVSKILEVDHNKTVDVRNENTSIHEVKQQSSKSLVADVSTRLSSLRKRNSDDSKNKSTNCVSVNPNDASVAGSEMSSSDSEDNLINSERQSSLNKRRLNRSKTVTPNLDSNLSNKIPMSKSPVNDVSQRLSSLRKRDSDESKNNSTNCVSVNPNDASVAGSEMSSCDSENNLINSERQSSLNKRRLNRSKTPNLDLNLSKKIPMSKSRVKDVSPRLSSLRKRNSKNKSTNFVSFNSNDGSVAGSSLSEMSSASDSENNSMNPERQPPSNKRRVNRSKITTPNSNSIQPNLSIEIPCSELRGKYKRTNNIFLADFDALNEILSFPKCSEPKKPKIISCNENIGSKDVVGDVNDESFVKNKAPKLKKPKKWVTNNLYKFLIEKLKPKYGIKMIKRAEKFVEYLCNKCIIISTLNEKEELKKEVDCLIIEMAKLQIIINHWDFYDFVQTYLPEAICRKCVPMTPTFNKPQLVVPPGDIFASIL